MKRTPFLFCLLWSLSLCLSACSDDDYPSNVADAIPDGEFRVLCLLLADTDLDGVISKEEALAVRKIDCMPDRSYVETISSLEGLHYFANLVLLRQSLYDAGRTLQSRVDGTALFGYRWIGRVRKSETGISGLLERIVRTTRSVAS